MDRSKKHHLGNMVVGFIGFVVMMAAIEFDSLFYPFSTAAVVLGMAAIWLAVFGSWGVGPLGQGYKKTLLDDNASERNNLKSKNPWE